MITLQKNGWLTVLLLLVMLPAISQNRNNKVGPDNWQTYLETNHRAIMEQLRRTPDMAGADQMIQAVAAKDPDLIYTYASSGSRLSQRIRQHPDSLVKTIARLSALKTGRMYFPFLDDLYRGKQTIRDIEPALKNDADYYKLLVKTQLSYAERLANNEEPVGYEVLEQKLRQKAVETYINVINGLHNASDAVRFRSISGLSATELYYLVVMGGDEIYTSSYLGVYNRIFQKLSGKQAGDELMTTVHHDHFKKWIKLAAAYNTLDDFLSRMEKAQSTALMQRFVNRLDQTKSLEDAVDVADAYASISNTELQQLILAEVQQNKAQASTVRAKNIYNLLNTIFLSKDSANNIDVTAELGIAPVFVMPVSSLEDSEGRIIIEQFIYGDEIGPGDFAHFLRTFRNANWKITDKKEWVEIQSTKGKKVVIYANKPLDEKRGLDAKAQKNLNDYLYKNKLYPTIAIHRGHSYHVRSTIEQLPNSARVVLLGSCGGFQNLDDVLTACPGAHIIATRQMGTAIVTQPMINLMADMLREGKDLHWPTIWKALDNKFNDKLSKQKFEDYVPPHKNLGAIFMNAYQRLGTTRQMANQ